MSRSAQFEVLLYCAARRTDEKELLQLLQAIKSWDSLVSAANYHGLTPLLADTIGGLDGVIPEDVQLRLKTVRRESIVRSAFFGAKLEKILVELNQGGVAVVPIKGPRLAELLYGDPSLRPSSDLDLLIKESDVPVALKILGDDGYVMGAHLAYLPVQKLVRWTPEVALSHANGLSVDLHWRLAPSDYPFQLAPEFLMRSEDSAERTLVYLCVHGAKHRWMRLIWIADIARLCEKAPNWDRVQELSAETNCNRPVLLGLLVAHELLGSKVPESVLRLAREDAGIIVLVRELQHAVDADRPNDPSSWVLASFNARLTTRWLGRVRHVAALLRAPTEAELRTICLPPALFPLYYPIRMARLTSKHMLRQ